MKTILLLISLVLLNIEVFSNVNDLNWSSYLGGNQEDLITASEYDDEGNLYVVGFSNSTNFKTTNNAYQKTNKGSYDIFITKYDQDMNVLWSTLFGGSGREIAQSFDIGSDGIWVVGETLSNNMPLTNNALQVNYPGGSGVVMIMKFSFEGELLYSSFYGGGGYDYAADVVIDNDNNAWITGRTLSAAIPVTKDAISKSPLGGYDSFLLKISSEGEMLYSSYIGGGRDDFGLSIEYSEITDEVYISGFTKSENLQSVGLPLQLGKNGSTNTYDGYFYAFDQDAKITWMSYFGGTKNDYPLNIKFDNDGNLLIHFYTTSNDVYVESNSYSKANSGSVDNYLLKIDKDKQYVWSTYLGGSSNEGKDDFLHKFGDLSIDDENNVYMLCFTQSNDIPNGEIEPYDANRNRTDAHISIFSEIGALKYSSYLGGNFDEEGWAVATYDDRYMVSGWTNSQDYPVTDDAIQKTKSSGKDGFISVFALDVAPCNSQYSSENGFLEQDLISNKYLGNSSVILTRKWAFDSGYMYYHNKLNLISGFETEFSFIISDPSRYFENPIDKAPVIQGDTSLPGADGIALVLTGEIPLNPALAGGDIGYGGLKNAIAIEIDLYENPENRDPNGNHLSVILPNEDGEIYPLHPKNDNTTTPDIIVIKSDSSQTYHCKVEYKNLDLKIYISETKDYGQPDLVLEDFPLFEYLNLEYSGNGFMGLTSSTGRSVEVHEITEWTICTSKSLLLTSVEDIEVNNLDFYPSPVIDNFIVSLPSNIESSGVVKVYDLLGNNVILREISAYQESVNIDASSLSKGAYSIVIESDNNVIGFAKFIKK